MFIDKLSNIFCLIGPTAVGKSLISLELCKSFPFEIISVDSALIYKYMNIGTDKPNKKILSNISHYLIDIIDPKDIYSVNNFFFDILNSIYKIIYINKKIPLLVGGTMMYYNILFNGLWILPNSNLRIRNHIELLFNKYGNKYVFNILKKIDYDISQKVHINDKYRIMRNLEIFISTGKKISFLKKNYRFNLNFNFIKIIILFENNNYKKKIINRFYSMLENGFEKEVNYLYNRKDLNIDKPSIKCIGYKQMWLYLDSKISYINMIKDTILKNFLLVKNQIKWIKKWINNSFIVYNNKNCLNIIKNYIKLLI